MNLEVYCDESRPDLFTSKNPSASHLVIGSLWLAASDRAEFKSVIHDLRDRHRIGGEFKWQKVSPSKLSFYTEIIRWFLSTEDRLRFRCIVVDWKKVKFGQFHGNDQELGFYKFYYQMLHHWILDFNRYAIFCDFKSNRLPDRIHVLQSCLKASNLTSTSTVQAIRSRESVLMQLCDVLTGMVCASVNGKLGNETAKAKLVNQLESSLGRSIAHTVRDELKFNVFVIDLGGGW